MSGNKWVWEFWREITLPPHEPTADEDLVPLNLAAGRSIGGGRSRLGGGGWVRGAWEVADLALVSVGRGSVGLDDATLLLPGSEATAEGSLGAASKLFSLETDAAVQEASGLVHSASPGTLGQGGDAGIIAGLRVAFGRRSGVWAGWLGLAGVETEQNQKQSRNHDAMKREYYPH
jgi:hypothetical protein